MCFPTASSFTAETARTARISASTRRPRSATQGTPENPAFRRQEETMGFSSSAEFRDPIDPHVGVTEVEWITTRRQTVVPYGLLIRTFETGRPPADGFRSPIDDE